MLLFKLTVMIISKEGLLVVEDTVRNYLRRMTGVGAGTEA